MDDSMLSAIRELYAQGDYVGLEAVALKLWPSELTNPPAPGLAEICRYLFVLARQRKDNSAVNLWYARSLSFAVVTGGVNTIAGLLLRPFFALTKNGSHDEARLVLNEILRVVPENHPQAELFRGRLYYEKLAYSYMKEGRYAVARGAYLKASKHCVEDPRGALKIKGGVVLAEYLALSQDAQDDVWANARVYLSEMETVASVARQNGFQDVFNAADSNLELMKTGKFEGWCPFETE